MAGPVSIVTPRFDPKPWGGRALVRFSASLPPDQAIGEALLTANDARVVAGHGAGSTLGEIVAADPPGRLGPVAAAVVRGRERFPLLVKLIDARENLSIQVHPNDAAAPPCALGKTEAWHIVAADPGAVLYVGLLSAVTGDEFAAALDAGDGSSARLLQTIPARPGTTVLIPAGTVHAIGAGVLLYEIQQPSDVTYRLDDWGRRDALGNPREMHLAAGLAATDPDLRPEPIEPVLVRTALGARHVLTACRFFALERLALPAGAPVEIAAKSSPAVVTVLQGRVRVDLDDEPVTLDPGGSAVFWPSAGESQRVVAASPAVLLVARVPDLVADVVAPLRASGIDDRTITSLSGPLADLRAAIKA